jgi:hypothetical protein
MQKTTKIFGHYITIMAFRHLGRSTLAVGITSAETFVGKTKTLILPF